MARDRRVRGEGAVFQVKTGPQAGRWVYSVDLGWQGGKRVRKTTSAATKRELRPKMNALDKRIEAGLATSTPTVAGWLTYWLDEVAAQAVRPRTLAGYRGYVKTWLIPQLGKHKLTDLEATHVRALHKTMKDAGRTAATVRQAHAILSRALTVAVNDGKIDRNPCLSAELPRNQAKGSHGKLTREEALKVMAYLRTQPPRIRSRWTTALMCGLRQGEALGLAWQHVDLEGRAIVVMDALQRINGDLTITDVKSRTSHRLVPMTTDVHEALTAYAAQPHGPLVWGPLDNKTDWKEWQEVLRRSGVERHTVHACRATCASILAEAGVPSKIIAEILGHSTPRITEEAYVHGDAAMHVQAFAAMDRLMLT